MGHVKLKPLCGVPV